MKKILLLLTLITLMMFSVNAGTLLTDQDQTGYNYFNTGLGNIQTFAVIGDENNELTINNITRVYDERYEFSQIGTDIFLEFQNDQINTTIEIFTSFGVDEIEATGINYIVLMEDVGTYYFQIVPSSALENFIVEVDLQNSSAGLISVVHTKDVYVESVTSVLNTFTNKIIELVELNLIVLEMGVYVLSFGFLIFVAFSIINFLINIHRKIHEAREVKERQFKNRSNRED